MFNLQNKGRNWFSFVDKKYFINYQKKKTRNKLWRDIIQTILFL